MTSRAGQALNPVRLALEAMAEAYGNGVLHRQAVTALAALDGFEQEVRDDIRARVEAQIAAIDRTLTPDDYNRGFRDGLNRIAAISSSSATETHKVWDRSKAAPFIGDTIRWGCSCGASWAEGQEPAEHAAARKGASSATETQKIDLWGNPNRAERMRSGADHGDFFIGSGLCKTCREPYPCKASEEPLPSSATETQDGLPDANRVGGYSAYGEPYAEDAYDGATETQDGERPHE